MTGAKRRVHIHAVGDVSERSKCGGWAVVLTHGSLQKEFAGSESETTGDVLRWRAVTEGLAKLKGPVQVELCVDEEPQETPEMTRLLDRYDTATTMRTDCADEPACRLAADLARHQRRGLEIRTRQASGTKDTVEDALNDFLAERWPDMYAFEQTDAVLAALRHYIRKRGEGTSSFRPWASDAEVLRRSDATRKPVAALPELMKGFIPQDSLPTAGVRVDARVVHELLTWLVGRGLVDRDGAGKQLARAARFADLELGIQPFLEACEEWLPEFPDDLVQERRLGEHVTVERVRPRMITFSELGEVMVPGPVANLAETGWYLLVSAASVRGRWYLTDEVVDLL
ncbi:ribonuclease H family protein [Amycolatopsis rifamycinica]|uniref:hypothetical protein n=1 Tax=Amycolatopsis rifamycinica TaxID=287986 RepID=UPI0013640386|nr:hypothetical protein [Amycolatopsis rifamycinica]